MNSSPNAIVRNYRCFPHQLILSPIVLSFCGGVVVSTPYPQHLALAVIPRLIEVASCARGVVDYGRGLKAVREDDIWVHGRDIDVVDQWFFHALWFVTKLFELFNDF
jgi:hypothetical protein